LYVSAAAKMVFNLALNPSSRGIVNLGSGIPTSLADVAEEFLLATKMGVEIQSSNTARRVDRKIVVADVGRLNSLVDTFATKDLRSIVGEYLTAERIKNKNDSD
jgi:UDP-glucose 4-epimerase